MLKTKMAGAIDSSTTKTRIVSDGGPGLDVSNVGDALNETASNITQKIAQIQADTNLSDTERMMDMQVAMNVWSSITTLRTNLIKTVSDSLKAIIRNVV